MATKNLGLDDFGELGPRTVVIAVHRHDNEAKTCRIPLVFLLHDVTTIGAAYGPLEMDRTAHWRPRSAEMPSSRVGASLPCVCTSVLNCT